MSTVPTILSQEHDPWFAKNSGKVLIGIAILLVLSAMGLIPSSQSRTLDELRNEHKEMAATLKVQCVHDSVTPLEEKECLTGILSSQTPRTTRLQ